MRQRIFKQLKSQNGISLIETVLLILILAISLPAVTRLLQQNVYSSIQMNSLNKATYYAQQRLEQVVAEYANTSQSLTGDVVYHEIINENYESNTLETGFTTEVGVSDSNYNGVNYKEITVTCSNPQGSPVTLKTWIADL